LEHLDPFGAAVGYYQLIPPEKTLASGVVVVLTPIDPAEDAVWDIAAAEER
tara:strand:- start:297 stop:449 length:153 start_codon:yes stop_codon:yes gene_type:complete